MAFLPSEAFSGAGHHSTTLSPPVRICGDLYSLELKPQLSSHPPFPDLFLSLALTTIWIVYFTYSFIVHLPSLESNLSEGREFCINVTAGFPGPDACAKMQYTEEVLVAVKGKESRANLPHSESGSIITY